MARNTTRTRDLDPNDFIGDEPKKAPEFNVRKPTSAGEKISIGCKLPNGLRLRNFRMIESSEPIAGGGRRTMQVAEHIGEDILLHGTATPFGVAPKCLIVNGYAITTGVDKDAFDKWMADNKDTAFVRNKMIIAHTNVDYVAGEAKENEKRASGMEPLDPVQDPRRPRPRSELDPIATATKQ